MEIDINAQVQQCEGMENKLKPRDGKGQVI